MKTATTVGRWNGRAKNRLKTIYNATTKLEFAYDYMGRRFSKKVYTKSGTSWVLSSEKAFAYNGYKQIAEFTVNGTTPTLSKSTVWQPASSGDLDVVLWYRDGSTVYTLLPDGNKNTRQQDYLIIILGLQEKRYFVTKIY